MCVCVCVRVCEEREREREREKLRWECWLRTKTSFALSTTCKSANCDHFLISGFDGGPHQLQVGS